VNRTVVFYKTAEGKCPVQDFLDSLPGKTAQKVVWVLRLLEDLDMVPATYFKKLSGTEDIWECRIQFGSNIYRIFCFFDSYSVVVLTHGFEKKSMKTPRREIERAESYRRDYLNRKGRRYE
jgi:phage-related protein